MSQFSITVEGLPTKLLLVLGIVVVSFLSLLAAKWNLANAVSTRADSKDLVDLAASLAPDDPQTRYAAGAIYDKTFESADAGRSLAEFEAAAANTPNNYLAWLAVSKARGRSGDTKGEVTAAKRALDLAPNYASVQWAYGNVLFRNGDERAMEHIRRAAESDKQYRVPAVDLMMLQYDSRLNEVRKALGETPAILAAICQNLVRNQKFAEAEKLWLDIGPEERHHGLTEQALAMASIAMNAKQFRFAQILYVDGGRISGSVGAIHDGGFENGVKVRGAEAFEWQIADGAEPQIAISNSIKKGGSNSLLLQFNTMEAAAFRQVSQVIAVEPGSSYSFAASYRTELKASSTLKFVITDTTTGAEIASTQPFDAMADWSTVSARFVVPATTDGITVSLARAACRSTICPINGKVWLDDISLTR